MSKKLYAVSLLATRKYRDVDNPKNIVVSAKTKAIAVLAPSEESAEESALIECYKAFSEDDGYSAHVVNSLYIPSDLVKRACDSQHTTALNVISIGVLGAFCTAAVIKIVIAGPHTLGWVGLSILLLIEALISLSAFFSYLNKDGE